MTKRPLDADALPLVNDPAAWASLVSKTRSGNEGFFSFYSSVANAITTNVDLMTVAIDDHAIVRGVNNNAASNP